MNEQRTTLLLDRNELERASYTLNMTKIDTIRYLMNTAYAAPLIQDITEVTRRTIDSPVLSAFINTQKMREVQIMFQKRYGVRPTSALVINVLLVSFNQNQDAKKNNKS